MYTAKDISDFNYFLILIKNIFGHLEKMEFLQNIKNGELDLENKDIYL